MPELPEVETICRGLRPVLQDKTLTRVIVQRHDLRWPVPVDFSKRVQGQQIISLYRRAKYLIMELANQHSILIHLGMSGRLILEGPLGQPHHHLSFITNTPHQIHYYDPRRFGLVTLCATPELYHHPLLCHLGLDALDREWTAERLHTQLAQRRTCLKQALLDQTVIAGLGNIYVCESLFLSRLSPQRSSNSLTLQESYSLLEAIRTVLHSAIAAGGSSLRDYRQSTGELGYFQHQFKVYGREKAPCVTKECNGIIQRILQGGRSTFYCLKCQEIS